MSTTFFSVFLALFGILGLLFLAIVSIHIFYRYRSCRTDTFRWYIRNYYLKQLAAIACLFCLAMAASYGILVDAWAIFYLLIAFKIGTWWLRLAVEQQS